MEPNNLTPEQKETLETIYGWSDKANYTEDEIKTAKEMFDKPEKFALLRKILQVLTHEERGLAFPNPQSLVQADTKDLQHYAIETAVNNLANEKIRISLHSFYRLLRGEIVKAKKEEFEKKNAEDFEEEKRKEEFEEKLQEELKPLGENL